MKDDKILKITEDVSWIGVLDPDIRSFDVVMETKYGATYNSYFINADKKVIVETTKQKFWDIYESKIRKVCNPEDIEFIILNHTEPDHSGNLANLLKIAPKAKVVGSGNVIRYLADLLNAEFPYILVKDGDVLDLGNKKLRFISAPNLHWPDSMYTYLQEDQIVFTCDSFGSHYCHEEMFDDKVGDFDDAFFYYFDVILKPYSKFLLKAIDKIRPLPIYAICNGHGPLLVKNWKKYMDLSEKLAKEAITYPPRERVFLSYVSSYGNTENMAKAIAKGLEKIEGVEIDFCNIEKSTLSEIEEKVIMSSAIIIGSPTINQNTFIPVYRIFAASSPIRDKGKLAGCFGSYGWSGEAQKIVESNLVQLKYNLFPESPFVKFTPSTQDLINLENWGEEFGRKMMELAYCTK
jgi:flavorubredoxin